MYVLCVYIRYQIPKVASPGLRYHREFGQRAPDQSTTREREATASRRQEVSPQICTVESCSGWQIAAADRRLERIEKAIKKLNGLDARRDTLEAAVEAADRAEEMARDLEYEIVSSAPDGEQLADDYEELGGGRCAVM